MTSSRRTNFLPAAALALTLASAACGSEDGAGPDLDSPASVTIANDDITLTQAGQTVQLQVTVRNSAGDVLPQAQVSFTPDSEGVVSVTAQGLVQALGDGVAEITVEAGSQSATAQVTVEIAAVALQDGVAVTGLSGPELGQRYYTFEVPAGSEDKVLMVRLRGGTGDADLGLNEGERPQDGIFNCVSAGGPNSLDNLEFCAVRSPAPGTWHVVIYGFEAYTGVTLDAALVPATMLESGTPVTDLAAPDFEVLFFQVDVPQGGALDLTLAGGTGDADLFGTSMPIVSVTQVEGLDCLSAAVGNDETCTMSPATPGTWLVFVLAFEAFEGATLTAEVSGGS